MNRLATVRALVPTVFSFPPIASAAARVLILGSMPGKRSLQASQYYAHPQNAFWPIVGSCCGFDAGLPYAERTRLIAERGIALWDVLQSCEREGSLDSDIVGASARANDFARFLARHGGIGAVLCNGGTAFPLTGTGTATLTTTRAVPAVSSVTTTPSMTALDRETGRSGWSQEWASAW